MHLSWTGLGCGRWSHGCGRHLLGSGDGGGGPSVGRAHRPGEIYGYCPPVRPVNATSASPSGPGSTSASPPAAATAATRAGGGGEQPTPMGWGAHGRHGPRGLASMDLGGGHPWVESPGGGGRVGGRRGAAAREWRRGEGAARVPGLAFYTV